MQEDYWLGSFLSVAPVQLTGAAVRVLLLIVNEWLSVVASIGCVLPMPIAPKEPVRSIPTRTWKLNQWIGDANVRSAIPAPSGSSRVGGVVVRRG